MRKFILNLNGKMIPFVHEGGYINDWILSGLDVMEIGDGEESGINLCDVVFTKSGITWGFHSYMSPDTMEELINNGVDVKRIVETIEWN